MPTATNISNGIIDGITSENRTTFITVTYTERAGNTRTEQTVRLVVGNSTIILNENGNSVPAGALQTGMTIDASFSSAMTRSIPPQANAFLIRIVRRPMRDNITVGRILNIDNQNRAITVIRDGNLSSIIRFNVPENAQIINRLGRSMNFRGLLPGMRVRIRHAAFMTASIPPQTTASEIRVL